MISSLIGATDSASHPQVIHGITIPLGMLGMHLPRAISRRRDPVVDGEPLLPGGIHGRYSDDAAPDDRDSAPSPAASAPIDRLPPYANPPKTTNLGPDYA